MKIAVLGHMPTSGVDLQSFPQGPNQLLLLFRWFNSMTHVLKKIPTKWRRHPDSFTGSFASNSKSAIIFASDSAHYNVSESASRQGSRRALGVLVVHDAGASFQPLVV